MILYDIFLSASDFTQYDTCSYMWTLKKRGYKLTYLQNRSRVRWGKSNLWLPMDKGGRDKLGNWD